MHGSRPLVRSKQIEFLVKRSLKNTRICSGRYRGIRMATLAQNLHVLLTSPISKTPSLQLEIRLSAKIQFVLEGTPLLYKPISLVCLSVDSNSC